MPGINTRKPLTRSPFRSKGAVDNTWLRKPRKPIGEAKRSMTQWELSYSRTFEQHLQKHRLDYWHCTVAQASQPGWPDYVVLGAGWHAFVELKASNLETGRAGKLRTDQRRYKDAIELAAGEYRVFTLPDDWSEVDVWLNGHTNMGIWGYGVKPATQQKVQG